MVTFQKNMLAFIFVPLGVFLVLSSFYRFVVSRDYMVSYEASCDPQQHSCFVGCEDDACSEEYFYAKAEKHAVNLYAQCGPDITDCDEANRCLDENDSRCSILYCVEADGDTCAAAMPSEEVLGADQKVFGPAVGQLPSSSASVPSEDQI